jgi:hypothetical protein
VSDVDNGPETSTVWPRDWLPADVPPVRARARVCVR